MPTDDTNNENPGNENNDNSSNTDFSQLFGNHKKETDRKLGNVSSAVEELKGLVQAALERSNQAPAPQVQQESSSVSLADLAITDPDKFQQELNNTINSTVEKKAQSYAQEQQQLTDVFTRLSSRYPEVVDPSSEVYKEAQTRLSGITRGRKASPAEVELALLQTIQDKGLAPIEQRQAQGMDDESYMGSGSGSEGSKDRRKRQKDKDGELPAASITIAQLMGLNTDDPKYLERLKKAHKDRKDNWGRYK